MRRLLVARDRIAETVSNLSTGFKIFSVMTIALVPLGLIALLASLQASRTADNARRADLRVAVVEASRKLSSELGADLSIARAATEATATPEGARIACFRLDMTFAARAGTQPRYALYGPDRAVACATPGFLPSPPVARIVDAAPSLLFFDAISIEIVDPEGRGAVVLRYSARSLGELIRPLGLAGTTSVALADNSHELTLQQGRAGAFAAFDSFSAPVGLLGLSLGIAAERVPFSTVEVLQAFLPLLMWASAVIVAFLVTDRLLLRPLLRLRMAIARLAPGERLAIPELKTPAREIRELAETFDAVGATIAAHEERIAQSLADQVKLTREVHHRVKNNLQVVASLISLHARGAPAGPVADAYSSIQRRVDALAIVHRNHYAELEQNYGVSAKALIGELASNLRTGIATSGSAPPISTNVLPCHVSQDVAVPIAFLVTELVELSIGKSRQAAITISLTPKSDGVALLAVASEGLARVAARPEGEAPRYSRVIDGLARQLRAPLVFDTEIGGYAIPVAILTGVEKKSFEMREQ
jgi:two-component system, sensor histidine kinase PdtaS